MTEKKIVRNYQKVGDNVYRISGTVRRSAVTGRYIVGNTSSRSARKQSSAASGQR